MRNMTPNRLHTLAVKQARAKNKKYRLLDGNNLFCEVLPTGRKVWRINYIFNRKQKTYTIGQFPKISLGEAREQRDFLKDKVSDGIDISQQKQLEKYLLQEETFRGIADAWLAEKQAAWSQSTYERVTRYLHKDVYPSLGIKEMDQITIPEIIAIVKNIEARGAIDAAKRVKGFIQQVFDYAVINCKASRNTAKDINIQLLLPKRTKKHFAAITDPSLLGELLRSIDSYRGGITAKIALKISPYIMLRPSELRTAKWSDINLERALWTVPAKRRKLPTHLKQSNRKEDAHLVPLAPPVVKLLKELYESTGKSPLVFPSPTGSGKPISDNTVRSALRRLDFGGEVITPHGFRGTASTMLHQQGYKTDVIEAQLGHKDANEVRAAYNHADYMGERKQMLIEWANYLDLLRES